MEQYNMEGNGVGRLPEGLLSALTSLTSVTLARNCFTSFPVGGPAQVGDGVDAGNIVC